MAVQKERQHKSKLTIDCDNTSLSTPCKKICRVRTFSINVHLRQNARFSKPWERGWFKA